MDEKNNSILNKDGDLFWDIIDVDIEWIQKHFSRCDKCGLEIFVSPFNTSDAVFYHMISASSELRFGNQVSRRQSLYDSVVRSPYGLNHTSKNKVSQEELLKSVRKVQQMRMIPFYGNFTCTDICKNTKIKI